MKEHFELKHVGRDRYDAVDNVREFCELKQLEYIGSFAKKSDGEVIGDVIRMGGQYYKAKMSEWHCHEGRRVSVAEFDLYRDFEPNAHWPLEECRVKINVWDIKVDDEGPVHQYAFENEADARKVISRDLDFDVWIDGEEVDREEFLNQ